MEAIDGIDPADRFFPVEAPINLVYVTVTSIDGKELLAIQHEEIMVVICSKTPCNENGATLRTFDQNGTTYTIQYAELGQRPSANPVIRDDTAAYWLETEFQAERPAWRTMDVFPGR